MLALALLAAAHAAPPALDCGTPAALRALGAGDRSLADPRVFAPPPGLRPGVPPAAPPPPDAKVPYGTPYEGNVQTENFLVTWSSPDVTEAQAELTAGILEEAWAALVVDQGWPQPVSTDTWLLWVVLDPDMAGTGLTTEYFTDAYPDGYPVVYINSAWSTETAFYRGLAAHEFGHALQYALRDYTGESWEPWYWEASAQWQSELADPDNDGYLYTSAWYADHTEYAYDSMVDYHQYGMFVFNEYLEEQVTGTDGLRRVWLLAAERPGVHWDEIIAEATDTGIDALWSAFSMTYLRGELGQSAGLAPVSSVTPLTAPVDGSVGYLGSRAFLTSGNRTTTLEVHTGQAVLVGEDGVPTDQLWSEVNEAVTVVGLDPGGDTTFTLRFTEGGSTGDDTGDDGGGGTTLPDDEDGAKTGCSHVSALPALASLLLPLLALARRRDG